MTVPECVKRCGTLFLEILKVDALGPNVLTTFVAIVVPVEVDFPKCEAVTVYSCRIPSDES